MSFDDEYPQFALSNPAELDAMWSYWHDGRLRRHQSPVLAFAEQNRNEILQEAGEARDPETILTVTKRRIARTRGVHKKSENSDQWREMEAEIWFHGQRGEHDPRQVALAWTAKWAPPWRRWRIMEYLFVADRIAEQIVALLLG